MTKIVVHTGAGPDDVLAEELESLDRPDIELRQCGRCSTPGDVLEAVRDADVALCYGEPYTEEVFAGAPKLKTVIRYGVGVDTVDLEAATEHGVIVGHLPDFCIQEVANHALMLMLACAKKVCQLDRALRELGWGAAKELRSPMGQIHGETVGLIAFGNISQAMARRCQALNMNVIAFDPYVAPEVFAEADVESVGLEELAARSDYVSCHLPLNSETEGFVDAGFFEQMKDNAYFINTSRGGVVEEADLIEALQNGVIAGAGLDVFESEPISKDHPFCSMPQVILTPHNASYADATMETLRRRVGQDALKVLEGELPDFVANPEVLDHRRT